MILSHSFTFSTVTELLVSIKRTFGDLDRERTACAQLHALKMMIVMTANAYMAKFEMLMGRTGFNEAALEDAFIQGLPQPILPKVYAQTLLLLGLDNWNIIMHNLDCLHQGFSELRVNPSDSNSNPSDEDPSHYPHSRHLDTQGHGSKPTQTWDALLL